MKENLIKEKDLLEKTGVSKATLGLYLKKGLIQTPQLQSNYLGKKGRWALYDRWTIDRIKKIRALTAQGYTLDAIGKEFLSEKTGEENIVVKNKLKDKILEKIKKDTLTKHEIDEVVRCLNLGWTMHTTSEAQQINRMLKKSETE